MRSWRSLIDSLRSPTRKPRQDDEIKAPVPERARSLRYGLSLAISLALLPIAVVSAVQGFERARFDINNENQRVVEAARTVAADEDSVLQTGQQALRRLSQVADVRNVSPYCDRALVDSLIGLPALSNLSRVDANGVVVCAALAGAKGMSARNEPLFAAARAASDVVVSGQLMSKVTHRPVIGGMLALRDQAGRFFGAIGFALDVQWLDNLLSQRHLPSGAAVAVFDRKGVIVATNNTLVAQALAAVPSSASGNRHLRSVTDFNGENWTYATSPLLGGKMHLALALPQPRALSPTYLSALMDFALPVLMIALSWVAIWYAAEQQITQWIVYLRRIVAVYGGGHYTVRPSLEGAPGEFLLLGKSMADMADGIVDRDRRLREALTQKTQLIKEIHHRVKNNLQIVISLLRLQADQLNDSPLREALTRAQARINALALVHRLLHEVDDQTTINLERLITELTDEMSHDLGNPDIRTEVSAHLSHPQVSGELAVPVALFAVEALSNAFRHAFPVKTGIAVIRVQLRSDLRDSIGLTIEDNGVGFDCQATHASVGLRLLHTFAEQLGGSARVVSRPGEGTTVTLTIDGHAEETSMAGTAKAA